MNGFIMEEREELRQAAQLLMENRWILRSHMPEEYLLIRRNEKKLRAFFREKCNWSLLVTARFYKLEKIPATPKPFMGIESMQSPEDYALLACVMAFLEEYETGGQFLLGDLAEALLSYYPQEDADLRLNWESYNWRKALIRILNFLAEENILKIVDDASENFISSGFTADGIIAGEALYEVTAMSRYFLRSFPKELPAYHSLQELCDADFVTDISEEAMATRQRRNRVYRELLLSPVSYRTEETEQDFTYLRNMASRIAADLEEWFDLDLEVYQDTVMAISHERNTWFRDIFPVRLKGSHDVILHLSHWLRTLPNWQERQPMTPAEWQSRLETFAAATRHGWTKEFREMSTKRLAETLLDEMQSWGMAQTEEDSLIRLLPALFRVQGCYPEQYNGEEQDKKHSKEKTKPGIQAAREA